MATSGAQEEAEFNYQEAKAALLKSQEAEIKAWQQQYDLTLKRQQDQMLALQKDKIPEAIVPLFINKKLSSRPTDKDPEDDVLIPSPPTVSKFKKESGVHHTRAISEDYILPEEPDGLKPPPLF
ncbi:MAG: hypothetical protein JSR17_09995 [Proteobacteria bacterium]|nr:hypothetical protein [Pseudomonadota bacterium]